MHYVLSVVADNTPRDISLITAEQADAIERPEAPESTTGGIGQGRRSISGSVPGAT